MSEDIKEPYPHKPTGNDVIAVISFYAYYLIGQSQIASTHATHCHSFGQSSGASLVHNAGIEKELFLQVVGLGTF